MSGRACEPDLIVAWPSAGISVMGPEEAVEIVFRRQVEEAEDPAAKRAELIEAYRGMIRRLHGRAQRHGRRRHRPARDCPTIIRALVMAEGKRVERPFRRNGVMPV